MILPCSAIRYSMAGCEIRIPDQDVLKLHFFGIKEEKTMKKHIDK